MVDSKYPVPLGTPTMIIWIKCGRMHRKSSARKLTCPRTIMALAFEFPWDPSLGRGLNPPSYQLEYILVGC